MHSKSISAVLPGDGQNEGNLVSAESGSGTETKAVGTRMDPELKAKWVAALRSGRYEQAQGTLIDSAGRLCCIGVFGRICGVSDELLRTHWGALASSDMPELEAIEPGAEGNPIRDMLSDMNDDGKTFPEIADYIEQNL